MNRKKLIEAIEKGIMASQMAINFKMHDLNLYEEINKLENEGYTLHRTYYSDGQFKYEFGADNKKNLTRDIDIITRPDEREVRLLCMSDLHYTSVGENRSAIHIAYNHAKTHGIHVILVPGDILHGKFSSVDEKYKPGVEQIKTFLKDFPFDNDIIVIGTGGDHDESIYSNDHIDPLKVISKSRHNIVLPGYFKTVVNIKNSKIILTHTNKMNKSYDINYTDDYQLKVCGHPHKYAFMDGNSKVKVVAPTISNIIAPISSFLEFILLYNEDNYLQKMVVKHYGVLDGKEIFLGETTTNITNSEVKNDNIENYSHKTIKNPYPYQEIPDNDTLVQELQKDNNEKTTKLETLEAKYYDVSKENEENKKMNEKLSISLETAEDQARKLDLINEQLKQDSSFKSEKICDLKNTNKKLKKTNFDLTVSKKELEDERKELMSELLELREKVSLYEEKLEAKSRRISEVEKDNEALSIWKRMYKDYYYDLRNKLLNQQSEAELPTIPIDLTEDESIVENTLEVESIVETEEVTIESFDDALDEVKDNFREQIDNEQTQKRRKKEFKQNKFDYSQRSKADRIEELKSKLRK